MSTRSPSLKDVKDLDQTPVSEASEPVKKSWFRGTLFQVIVVGVCSFLSPGMWNGMNATGAGGAQSPYLVNAGNALVFGLMVFFCLIGTTVTNKIGFKYALAIGTIGYVPYAVGLYENKTAGLAWPVLFGAACCGISAGIFWSTEGSIVLGFPEARKRGVYLAIWLGFKNGGSIIAGCINLGLNASTSTGGSVSSNTYLVFIALQALAPFVALLLSEPRRVQRADGTPVLVGTSKLGFIDELRQIWSILKRPEVLTLMPLAFYSSLFGPWTGTYLSLYFSVRARALASLVSALLQVGTNFVLGAFLDFERVSVRSRTRYTYIFLAFLGLLTWTWALVIQVGFTSSPPLAKYDWVDPGFARAYVLYLFWTMSTALIQNYLYFAIGGISREPVDIGRLSSILRSVESAGSAVGYGITARKTLPHLVPLGINVGAFGVSTIVGWWSIKEIGVTLSGGYAIKPAVPVLDVAPPNLPPCPKEKQDQRSDI